MKYRSICVLIGILCAIQLPISGFARQENTPTPGGLVIGPTPTATVPPPPTATAVPQHAFEHPIYGWQLSLPDSYEITYSNPDDFSIDGVNFLTITPDQIGWLDYTPDFADASDCLRAGDDEVLLDSGGNPIRQRDPDDSWELFREEDDGPVQYVRCVVLYRDVALLRITAFAEDAETYNAEVAPLLQLVSDNLQVPAPGSAFEPQTTPSFSADDFVRLLPEEGASICLLYFEPQANASWSSPDGACSQRYFLPGEAVWVNGVYWWELAFAEGVSAGYSAGYAPETKLEPWPETTDAPVESTLIYAMDTGDDLSSWNGTDAWSMEDGEIHSTSAGATFEYLLPPYQVTETDDYAIEAEIRWTDATTCGAFGLSTRGEAAGAYHMMVTWLGTDCDYDFMNGEVVGPGSRVTLAAMDSNGSPLRDDSGCFETYLDRPCPKYLEHTAFEPGDEWHTYRVEVRGDEIRVYIDGEFVLFAIDSQLPSGSEVGLWSYGANFIVRALSVYALE